MMEPSDDALRAFGLERGYDLPTDKPVPGFIRGEYLAYLDDSRPVVVPAERPKATAPSDEERDRRREAFRRAVDEMRREIRDT